jgi:hypothetical protein
VFRRCVWLTVISLLILCFAGCRLGKDQVVGRYSVSSQGGDGPTAIELRGDGTFSLYRSVSVSPYGWSGDGTWELINQTFFGPGIEAVYLTSDHFMGPLPLTQQDGRACLEVERNTELWCKSK